MNLLADEVCNGAEGNKVADVENLCFYHECVRGVEGKMLLLPRRCALGTSTDEKWLSGFYNPCIINFNGVNGMCNANAMLCSMCMCLGQIKIK